MKQLFLSLHKPKNVTCDVSEHVRFRALLLSLMLKSIGRLHAHIFVKVSRLVGAPEILAGNIYTEQEKTELIYIKSVASYTFNVTLIYERTGTKIRQMCDITNYICVTRSDDVVDRIIYNRRSDTADIKPEHLYWAIAANNMNVFNHIITHYPDYIVSYDINDYWFKVCVNHNADARMLNYFVYGGSQSGLIFLLIRSIQRNSNNIITDMIKKIRDPKNIHKKIHGAHLGLSQISVISRNLDAFIIIYQYCDNTIIPTPAMLAATLGFKEFIDWIRVNHPYDLIIDVSEDKQMQRRPTLDDIAYSFGNDIRIIDDHPILLDEESYLFSLLRHLKYYCRDHEYNITIRYGINPFCRLCLQ